MDPTVGKGKVVAIDYSSPNIAKPFHGGHLRGTILGNFATRLLRGFGHQVVGINYLGDWGKQYGKLVFCFCWFLFFWINYSPLLHDVA